jgi:hypothetical protein
VLAAFDDDGEKWFAARATLSGLAALAGGDEPVWEWAYVAAELSDGDLRTWWAAYDAERAVPLWTIDPGDNVDQKIPFGVGGWRTENMAARKQMLNNHRLQVRQRLDDWLEETGRRRPKTT